MPRRFPLFPLFRLGLLVVIGSVAASAFQFYISVGQSMAAMSGDEPATTARDLLHHFRDHFLFSGAIPGILFWVGVVLMFAGVFRGFRR